MLVLKNVGSNETIGVMKRIFDLGYDILQKELDKYFIDCDTAFNLCVLYYNEFYHSDYNRNGSEYDEITEFFTDDKVSFDEWLKRISLMFQICQYYELELGFDFQTMTIYAENKGYLYHYKTMSEFALGWMIHLLNTNKETGFSKFKVWSDDDLNRLREMGGLPIPKDKIQDLFNFEFFVTDKEIESGLYINRYEIEDDDELYQAIDDCEMDTNDYVIATFKPADNISFNIFTTHNLYNVYIDKVVYYEDSCDTVEMNNITMDACEWNNKNDIINYFLVMNY